MKATAGGEVRLVLEADLEQFLWLPRLVELRIERPVEVLIFSIVEETAGHVQELADGDVLSVRYLGLVVADRVVEPQLALVHQLQNDRPGKRLGVAADAKVVVGRDRGIVSQVRGPEGLAPRALPRDFDVDERPGNPQLGHLLFYLRP